MTQLLTLTSRNLKQYLRDKWAVIFSLMSMFIVILLMFLFLGDANTDGITDLLSHFPGRDADADAKNAGLLVLAWTCAGIISINAVTVTMSCLSYMIKDRESGRLAAIYTAPLSRLTIAASYILSAWLASVIVCVLTLAVAEIYCVISGMAPFSVGSHLRLLGMIAANSFTYAALMYLVAAAVKSQGAWGGIGTVISTLVGFLGGIYFPVGQLSAPIAAVMKCTPVLYGAALFREKMTREILGETFRGIPAEVVEEFREVMGISLSIQGHKLSGWEEIAVLLVCGVLFLAGGAAVVKFGKRSDR